MMRRFMMPLLLVLAFCAGLVLPFHPAIGLQAQTTSRYFPETQHTLRGLFLQYWADHGALAQQGYPLTEEFAELSALDGKTYTVQYFERAVFERHPENAGTPYEVLLAQLGTYELQARYPAGPPASTPNTVTPRVFPETGHTVGGKFRAYWESHGGLAQQGYPITDEFSEQNKLNGQTYTVQYFERAIFELHPENADTAFEVLLTQLGKYQLDSRYPNNSQPAAAPVPPPVPGPPTPVPTAGTPPTPAPTPLSANCAPGAGITVRAWVSDATPLRNSDVIVYGAVCNNGAPLAGIPMHTVWHYRSTTPGCDGVTEANGVASCTRTIGQASLGFAVVINVTFTVNGRSYTTQTSFTPR